MTISRNFVYGSPEARHNENENISDLVVHKARYVLIFVIQKTFVIFSLSSGQLIPPHRSVAQIVRSLSIFDFTSSETPPAIFEETSNHLARLVNVYGSFESTALAYVDQLADFCRVTQITAFMQH